MKRRMKKFMSLLLSVSMVFSVFTMPVYASPADGTESEQTVESETTETEDNTTGAAEETQPEATQPETTQPEETQPQTTTVEESFTTYTVNADDIDVSDVTTHGVVVDEEVVVDENDPIMTTVEEELGNIKVLNDDGEPVPLTEEQIQSLLYIYQQYQDQWADNKNILGVQLPFFLNYNEDSEDGLGVMGEMLVLAGYSVEDVRAGKYKYDELMGMVQNFLYADEYALKFYTSDIENSRAAVVKEVEKSGAKTLVQKMLVINDWIAHNTNFDMAYIMKDDDGNPIMVAEEPKEHEHYRDIYNDMYAMYKEQIKKQFHQAFYEGAIKQTVYSQALGKSEDDATDEEKQAASQYAEDYMTEHKEEISKDPEAFVESTFGSEAAEQFKAQEEVFMDTASDDLGGATPNQVVESGAQQGAEGLTNGIIGAWEGNHVGVLAEGIGVCAGYSKAFAYLLQYMNPAIYGISDDADMSKNENWKSAKDLYYGEDGKTLDINQNYLVDMVRITFDANVSMFGEESLFGEVHFWNAVKVDGKWYYVDPCYTDIYVECMSRDRVEIDGTMNHMYFMFSHSSAEEMYRGNMKEIATLYDGEGVSDDTSYEDSWFARIASNTYISDGKAYYMYDSSDQLSMMREYRNLQSSGSNSDFDASDFEALMEGADPTYKLVYHEITSDDTVEGGADSDYTTLIEFNHEEEEESSDAEETADTEEGEETTDTEEEGSVALVYNPGTNEMEENELLTELFAQYKDECDIYPSIKMTTALYDGKLYFNLSNCVLSYDLSSGAVEKVKEYNTVYATYDDTVAFRGMAFSVSNEETNLKVSNHPIAALTIKDDGHMYVSVATNFAFISGKNAVNDTEHFGYAYEESNYNPNYSTYMQSSSDSSQLADSGYSEETNDNDEFMWSAVFVDTMDMTSTCSHTYESVTVEPTCGRDGFTENRCTKCGAAEADSRVVDEGSALDAHHYVHFDETYYTKADNGERNTGECYVCTVCGFAIEEPDEPRDGAEDEEIEEYEKEKAIWDNAVETAGHSYEPANATWSEDSTSVTFSKLECSSVCPHRKAYLDCLLSDDTISVECKETTAEAKVTGYEGECTTGVTAVYTAEGETEDGYKYTASNKVEQEPGEHHYVADFVWGEAEDEEAEVPYTVTATKVTCEVCGAKAEGTLDVKVELNKDKSIAPTCEEDGKNVYTATATVTNDDEEVIATATEDKSEDSDVVPATGHDYDAVWEWKETEEGSEHEITPTLTLTCKNDETEEPIVLTEGDEENDIKVTVDDSQSTATCTDEGVTVYNASVEYEGKTYEDNKKVTVPALGHEYKATFTWNEEKDSDEKGTGEVKSATAKVVCINGCEFEAEDVEVEVATVADKCIAPTCTEPGKNVYTATATFTDAEGKENSITSEEKEFEVPATGHAYKNDDEHAEWTWADADENAEVPYTATLVLTCTNEGCGTKTDVLDATVELDEKSTSATCTEKGTAVYKATVEYEGQTFTSEKSVEVDALGHTYEAKWTWTKVDDKDAKVPYKASAVLTCKICGDKTESIEADNVEITSSTEATCTEDGETTYTASITYNNGQRDVDYYSEKTIVTKATGHDFGEWETVKEPTDSEAGLKRRYCTNENCEAYEEEDIEALNPVSVLYQTHVQSIGWEDEWAEDGQLSGTEGKAKRLESIKIKLNTGELNYSGDIVYTTHVQSKGWLSEVQNGTKSGTEGQAKRLEAIKIYLTGEMAEHYDVYYCVHAQTYGWLNWAKNGEYAGTAGLSKRLEAIRIVLVKKGGDAPKSLSNETRSYVTAYSSDGESSSNLITYRTHVQTYGWQDWKYDGVMSGTSGESKRLEAIEIKLPANMTTDDKVSGSIRYKTHIQSKGWETTWTKEGKLSGTEGQSKRLEGIMIELTGDMKEKYDVYYCVHAQTYGWLGWAKNGEEAGTEGLSKRLEGIKIVLVEKGGEAPKALSNQPAFIKK